MRYLLPLAGMLVACAPQQDDSSTAPADRDYATQVDAPTLDYATLTRQTRLEGEGYVRRNATGPMPPDAKAVGQSWFERLEAENLLLGAGFDGKGPGGPSRISMSA